MQLVKAAEGTWDLEKIPAEDGIHIGRQPGEDKALWASLACWDFATRKLIQFRRKWIFAGWVQEVPKPVSGDTLPRFLWLYLNTTKEDKFESRCRKVLKELKYKIIPGDPETVKFEDS